MDVDDIDRGIVVALQRDARATFAEIGAEVNLSAPAVKRRVDRLLASGAIRGFTAVVDPVALGWSTEAYVEVSYSGVVSPRRLTEDFSGVPEAVSAWTVSGVPDAVVQVQTRDVRHLEEVLQRIRGLPDVTGTQTEIVLSRLFRRTQD
ncbi:DNA-binding transcriptional regulator, Lrp family [Klenkia marina]|uniref:DNA-binding transcriptional regulator, Lrp family n=1 Tax=Klenkia marina TaxID=1960309 RepID=A0A1G4XIG4_9ACTN|nr:Lrp/AsnC family transcriptional regulator [Klenkia marina]SCX40468.1 DNA-binding transcriptional regulator, Lrp family [Klenkia marina]